MKEFEVIFIGEWILNGIYTANSKEEALEKALEEIKQEGCSLSPKILETYVNDEKIDGPMITVD